MSDKQVSPVQEKIPCVYVIGVTNEASSKRPQQSFKVVATSDVTDKALKDEIGAARATEKLDGTCCLVDTYNGEPWLWARHDRKPSKSGERRFAAYKKNAVKNEDQKDSKEIFSWTAKDFKEVPANWIPASRLEVKDGFVLPDGIGHTPGWVPVDVNARQHCWHLSAVDLPSGVALVLREDDEPPGCLRVTAEPLSSLCGQTCELIGTNINGNPYGLGSKSRPVHLLTPHGDLGVCCPDVLDYDTLHAWLSSDTPAAQVEGVVWHTEGQQLHKLHRHHLSLPWPVEAPHLSTRRVKVTLDMSLCGEAKVARSQKGSVNLFAALAECNGRVFDSLRAMCDGIFSIINDDS